MAKQKKTPAPVTEETKTTPEVTVDTIKEVVEETVVEETNDENTTEVEAEVTEVEDTPTEKTPEPTTVETKKEPKVELSKEDIFFKGLKMVTQDEKKLAEAMRDYMSVVGNGYPTAADLKKKIVSLKNILVTPIISGVPEPGIMYDMVEKFITEYRQSMVHESVAMQNADAIDNQVMFTRMVTIYNVLIALVDFKTGKSKSFNINFGKVSSLLGPKFDKFISWATMRYEKLNKR